MILIIPNVKRLTMIPEIMAPRLTKMIPLFAGISRIKLAKAPVQPPIKGMGIAVKTTTIKSFPKIPNFSVFLLTFKNNQPKNFLKKLNLSDSHCEINLAKTTMPIKGTILPATEKR